MTLSVSLSRWPRTRKAAIVALVALVGLPAFYALAANALLSSGEIARLVSKDPETLRLMYASARTFWPGRVHVEGIELRGREAHVEWQVRIDAADVDLSLLDLLRRRFHARHVVAKGVTFRARFRLEPAHLTPARIARLPPIDGFEAVPVAGDPPESSEASGRPWIIDMQGIDASAVREVWIDGYRVAGDVHAHGGFTLGAGHLTVAPSTADLQSLSLVTGPDPIASDMAGHLEARIETVDLGETPGVAPLRYLTARSELHGKASDLRFLGYLLNDDALSFSGGAGEFRSSVSVVDGLVKPGTTSRVELEPLVVSFEAHRLQARPRLDIETKEDDAGTWTEAELHLTDVTFAEADASMPAVTCRALTARARARQVGLADAPKAFTYSWDAPHVDARDLRVVDHLLPKTSPFHLEHGEGAMSTHGAGDLEGATAQTTVDARLVARVQGARVATGLHGTVPMKAIFVGARSLDLSGTELALTDPALPEWWGKVALTTATIDFLPASVTLFASTSAHDARPFLSFYSALQGTSAISRTAIDLVPTPMIESSTANLQGAAGLRATKDTMRLDHLDVGGASSRLRGTLDERGGRMNGGILIEAGPTAVGISFANGKTGLVLVDAPRWYETKVSPVHVR